MTIISEDKFAERAAWQKPVAAPQTRTTVEMFDKYGKFVMPSAEAISELDPEAQKRFAAVQAAASVSEAATEMREAAEAAVLAALAERDNAEADLLRIRPRLTQTEVVKDWILSQRAQ